MAPRPLVRAEPNGCHATRFLDTDELARLGRALDAREAQWPEAVAAICLLAVTGCRRSEVLNLRWRDIGANAIKLPVAQTGPRAVPLGETAGAPIYALPGKRRPEAYLFPRRAEGRGLGFSRTAGARSARTRSWANRGLHDLRHTAAQARSHVGQNLPRVGKLLGHRRHQTTAGYAHLADVHVVDAAEKVRNIIAGAMAVGAPVDTSLVVCPRKGFTSPAGGRRDCRTPYFREDSRPPCWGHREIEP